MNAHNGSVEDQNGALEVADSHPFVDEEPDMDPN
jgi:hypothetical protein